MAILVFLSPSKGFLKGKFQQQFLLSNSCEKSGLYKAIGKGHKKREKIGKNKKKQRKKEEKKRMER